jgi:hypothetical protein
MNVESIGRLTVTFQVSSDGEMLNANAPPNLIEKRCRHTLFDAGCGLLPSQFSDQRHRNERQHRSQRQYESDAAGQVLLPWPHHIPIWTECDESEHDVLREVLCTCERAVPARASFAECSAGSETCSLPSWLPEDTGGLYQHEHCGAAYSTTVGGSAEFSSCRFRKLSTTAARLRIKRSRSAAMVDLESALHSHRAWVSAAHSSPDGRTARRDRA